MTSEWERLKARMVKVVEREASTLEVDHGWTRKLSLAGSHKYIYSYFNDKGYISQPSNGEWKYNSKKSKCNYVYGHPRTFNGFELSDGKVRKIMYTVEYEHETIEIVILDDKGYEDDLKIEVEDEENFIFTVEQHIK